MMRGEKEGARGYTVKKHHRAPAYLILNSAASEALKPNHQCLRE